MIEIFSRHCTFSTVSAHKRRWPDFSREACYRNLLETCGNSRVTFFWDSARGRDHFLNGKENVLEINAGTESSSFLQLLAHVESRNFSPDTILYFVEDDYLHRAGWVEVLLEAMRLPNVDYVTLYDHRDKYFLPMYKELQSQIFVTPTCHWRTVPSTTQTFAVRWKTLQEDLAIHRKFSTGVEISEDHKKFVTLTKRGRRLISPMPGWSTHAEPENSSPCVDWESINKEYLCHLLKQ